jgi:hypothetical protein
MHRRDPPIVSQPSITSAVLEPEPLGAVSVRGIWHREQPLLAYAPSTLRVVLPSHWIDCTRLEWALRGGRGPFAGQETAVHFSIPQSATLMVDVAVRLLSLVNQLVYLGKRVILDFAGDVESRALRYLDRIGFFDQLHPNVIVRPERAGYSAAQRLQGTHRGLVEIVPLRPVRPEHGVPGRVEHALLRAMRAGEKQERIAAAAYYLVAELTDNVYKHADSPVAGYAVLQVYHNARLARLAVTDSGEGLLRTLRTALPTFYPDKLGWGPERLIYHAFSEGKLSRLGHGHGAGLKTCADRALQLRATMELRLSRYALRLSAKHGVLCTRVGHACEQPALIHGTHVMFEFPLD